MTAWQDLPPQTRRQARRSERQGDPVASATDAQNPQPEEQRPTRNEQTAQNERSQDHAPEGSRRARRSAEGPAESNVSAYRVRDYSPKAIQWNSADSVADDEAADRSGNVGAGDLNYFTQAKPIIASAPDVPLARSIALPAAAAVPPPVVDKVPTGLEAPPRPLTRRELRELETRQGLRPVAADAPAVQAPQAPPALIEPTPIPRAVEPTKQVEPTASAEPVVFLPSASAAPVAAPVPVSPVAPFRVEPAPIVTELPTSTGAIRGIDLAPQIFAAPTEQWQAEPTASEPGESFIRRVGAPGSAITTSALVMPAVPQASDITRPFSSTGEILVTGSIELPHILGSIGAHPNRVEPTDIDALFAAEDNEFSPTDSAPVRAIRAVSTHTSTHGVISAKKPVNSRLPTAMAITAGVLAVGVGTLVAAGFVYGYF